MLTDRRQIHGTELIHVDDKHWLNSPCIAKQIGEKLVFVAAFDEGMEAERRRLDRWRVPIFRPLEGPRSAEYRR